MWWYVIGGAALAAALWWLPLRRHNRTVGPRAGEFPDGLSRGGFGLDPAGSPDSRHRVEGGQWDGD
ncbi:MAG: hypothetical protein QM747_15055 [Nocardioides sp.]